MVGRRASRTQASEQYFASPCRWLMSMPHTVHARIVRFTPFTAQGTTAARAMTSPLRPYPMEIT